MCYKNFQFSLKINIFAMISRCREYLLKFSARHMDGEGNPAYSAGKINHENVKPVMIQAVHRKQVLNRAKE